MKREIAAARDAQRSAERDRDDALLRAARCMRCERTVQTILSFWVSDGGKHTDERIRPVSEETQKWSLYVEKMRALVEHVRAVNAPAGEKENNIFC